MLALSHTLTRVASVVSQMVQDEATNGRDAVRGRRPARRVALVVCAAVVVEPRRASTALRWATERAPVPAQVTNGDGHAGGGGVGNVAVRVLPRVVARTAPRAHRAPTDGWAMGEGCWCSVG